MSALLNRILEWLFDRVLDFEVLLEDTLAFWESIGDGEEAAA